MRLGTESDSETSLIGRALSGWISAVCRRPRMVIAIAAALCAVSVYASVVHLKYQTQRSDLISPHKDCQRRWQEYVSEFGDDDDIVVVVKGRHATDGQRMKAAIHAIAKSVERRPEHFDRLFYQVDLRPLRNRALLLLPNEQIHRIGENLQNMGLLLDVGTLAWRNLTLVSLLREACVRTAKLSPGEPIPADDEPFFTQLQAVCQSAAQTLDDVSAYRNPWTSLVEQKRDQRNLLDEPQYFFSGDGTLSFLLARPTKDPTSFTGAAQSVEAMRAVLAEVRPSYPDLEIGLTGLPVLETDEMVAAELDTRRASWLAIAGVTLLFFIVYRSVYYPLLTVGTLLLGTSWAMGWTTLTVGHLNILSATFAVMLIGMGDYGVLWVMRYERERQRGLKVEDALLRTAVCVGTGTLTAALTTTLAFYAAMLADFKAVAELGWIAGSGVLLCAIACFTALPAALMICDRREMHVVRGVWSIALRRPQDEGQRAAEVWLPGFAGRSRLVLLGSLALTVTLGVFSTQVSYDHNLLNLQPRDLDSVKWEKILIEHTAGASWHAISHTLTREEALELKARYEQLPDVSRVAEIASLVPPDQDAKFDRVRDIHQRLSTLPALSETIPHQTPNPVEVRNAIHAAISAVESLVGPFSPPVLGDVRAAIAELGGRLTDDAGPRLRQFEERMADDLLADLHRLREVAQAEPITLDDVPPALRERFVGRSGSWKLQVFANYSLWDFEPLERFVNQIQSVDPEATGKPFSTVEGLLAMKNGFLRAGLYAFLAIGTVLLIDFRNLRRTLIAISPLLMGLTLALGIMGLLGVPLNPANMIALPLVLGVGVDNGVHVLHDFLARKAEGRLQLSLAIGRGVLVKALTTMIGFGTLMISTQRGLAGLGFCLTLGVACCMATALVFLPAALMARRRVPQTSRADLEVAPRRLAA